MASIDVFICMTINKGSSTHINEAESGDHQINCTTYAYTPDPNAYMCVNRICLNPIDGNESF